MTASHDTAASPASIDLPVFLIARRAILSPFFYLPEFIKFGGFTILLGIGARVLSSLVAKAGLPPLISALLLMIAQFAIATPFIVTWTNLMVGGRTAVRDRSVFRYGPVEWRYVLGSGAVIGVSILTGYFAGILITHARQTYDRQLVIEAVMFDVVLLGALFIAAVRISFLFPAIATDTYASLQKSWSQTKGHFERLLAMVALTYAPFIVIADIFIRLTRDRDFFGIVVVRWIVESVNATLAWGAFAAGIALAYKIVALKLPIDSPSATESAAQ